MPLPLILGAALLYGAKKTYNANQDIKTTNQLNSKTNKLLTSAKSKLKKEIKQMTSAKEELLALKLSIYEDQILPFVNNFSKIKNIDFQEIKIIGSRIKEVKVSQFPILKNDTTKVNNLIVTGASATVLSNFVVGGFFSGPAFAVSAFKASAKAELEKNNAYENLSKAKLVVAEINLTTTTTKAIKTRFIEAAELLRDLEKSFAPIACDLSFLVGKETNYANFTREQQLNTYKAFQLAVTIKNVLEAPLLTKKGTVNQVTGKRLKKIKELL